MGLTLRQYYRKKHNTLFLILFLGVTLKVAFVALSSPEHLVKYQEDDSFFYYTIARNFIQNGEIFAVNEGIATNGFHPLYLVTLVPIFLIFYPLGINAPIYAVLVFFIVLNAATALFLYKSVVKLSDKRSGLLAATIWMFNPFVYGLYLTGMETPVQVLLLSVLLYTWLTLDNKLRLTGKKSLIIGVLIGLLILSRADSAFIALGVAVSLLLKKISRFDTPTSVKSLYDQYRDVVFIIISSLLVTSPWFLYNLVQLERLTPISGEAIALGLLQVGNPEPYLSRVAQVTFAHTGGVLNSIVSLSYYLTHKSVFDLVVAALVLLSALIIPTLYLLVREREFLWNALHSLDFLLVASILYYPFYHLYLVHVRSYIIVYTSFLTVLAFSIVSVKFLDRLISGTGSAGAFRLLVAVLLLLFLTGWIPLSQQPPAPNRADHIQPAKYIDDNISDEAVIATNHAGVIQYYTVTHDIIILDPVINPETLEARKDGELLSYIQQRKVTHVYKPRFLTNTNTPGISAWRQSYELREIQSWDGENTYRLYEITAIGQNNESRRNAP